MSEILETIDAMLPQALAAMASAAKSQWKKASTAVTGELKIFAHRLAQIAEGLASGQLSKGDAKDYFAMAKNSFVSLVAMLTALTWALAQSVINAGLAVLRQGVNTFVGFELV